MSTVPMSTKGRIVLPAAVRKALGLKPGMRVILELDGKGVRLTRALEKKTPARKAIRSPLNYTEPVVPISAMRVTKYKG